ncbi:integrase core domain-containing protein [Pseudarthrobacter sp. Y6]|uniref:integrase core domain-containing protein n=1 Tax=Pseudarthrobacter sp. Y6 TaxID=3418422 RepID=UPI003CF7BBAB
MSNLLRVSGSSGRTAAAPHATETDPRWPAMTRVPPAAHIDGMTIFAMKHRTPEPHPVASHVAAGETSEAALAVVKKGVGAHGVPQRLLTDNGVALNPSRRGWEGQLVAHVSSLGVEAITGKPYKPTTQGKNERFHQTLFRWLDKQPLAQSHAELQAQVDRFDLIYNTERPHQGLPGRITPQQSWDATAAAEAPRPKPLPVLPEPQESARVAKPPSPAEPGADADTEAVEQTTTDPGTEASFETTASQKISGSIAHPAASPTRQPPGARS